MSARPVSLPVYNNGFRMADYWYNYVMDDARGASSIGAVIANCAIKLRNEYSAEYRDQGSFDSILIFPSEELKIEFLLRWSDP